ncbi:hypothetical protein GCM10010405_47130 [Streptomyces macrosporus]|uniref:Uncharacterized protein n=1 Tax=Streptomyces macrosporus TaxID=44032 RepID=A0ABN3KET8_9ACTN
MSTPAAPAAADSLNTSRRSMPNSALSCRMWCASLFYADVTDGERAVDDSADAV